MKTAYKWNFEEHYYVETILPDGAACYCEDMDELVSCANCGENIKYGDGYTSKQYHTKNGFGYIVCEDCYRKEREKDAN